MYVPVIWNPLTPLGDDRSNAGYFTSWHWASFFFPCRRRIRYRNHCLHLPDRGISGLYSLCCQVNRFHFRAAIIDSNLCFIKAIYAGGNKTRWAVRHVLNKTRTIPFIRAYKVCLARSRVYEKIASYLRSVIICGPIVYCRIVEVTRKTLLIIY